jgi:hypothetical protein
MLSGARSMLGQLFPAKGGSKMKRIAMAQDWSRRKYSRYLEDRMLSASTIESYLNRVKLFLEWAQTDTPSTSQFDDYREVLR